MRSFRRSLPSLALATCAALLALAGPAAADRTFTPRYTTVDRADFAVVANTLETCSGGGGCNNVRNGTTNGGNNGFSLVNVDVDGDASTFNSSSATLAMPAGATVLFAGLYWGADTTAGSGGAAAPTPAARDTVRFRTPVAAYQTLTATTLDTDSLRTSRYQGFADVTSLVQAGGNGAYWAANVQAGTGTDRYAGWSMIVVWRDPAQLQFKKVNVWDGFTSLVNGSRPSVNITLGGFTTPALGVVRGRLGLVSYEGDQDLSTESATLSGNALSDAVNPAANPFNSTISRNGAHVTAKNPNYVNQTGFDADELNVDGKIPNAVTSTTLALRTTGDLYLPGAVALVNDEDFTAPANTTAASITGTAQDRQVLTADAGAWSGNPTPTFTYQWRRCNAAGASCTDISGATGATYTLVPGDVGATIRVVVTGTNVVGSATSTSAQTSVVGALAPSNSVLPAISGTPRDGLALTASTGTWDGTPTLSYAYQWRRCDAAGAACANIAGATSASYTAVPADVGGTLRVVVTADNPAPGTVSATSAQSAVVAAAPPVNSALPAISGTAQDGQTLSASAGTWTGTPTLTFTYPWRRCDASGGACADIAGATSASYAAVPADVGGTLRVLVTADNAAPGTVSATSTQSAVVAAAPPVNSALPAISGTVQDGQTLSASAGTWTGTPAITFTYQWRRCDAAGGACTTIAGATSSSYTAVAADVGGTLRVVVTADNAAPGTVSATSAQSAVVAAAPPLNTALPTVSGTAQDGQALSASAGTWTGTPALSFTYQWRRCDALGGACADVPGATSSSYTAAAADVGGTLRVVVTADNAAPGTVSVTSAPTALVAAAPPANTALPAIGGTLRDGQVLSASTGTWTGTPPITYAFQWRRCDSGGGACADLPGESAATYTATAADVNRTLRVVVTATNAAGSAAATSAATAQVEAAPPVNTALPAISGTLRDGETLSASTGTWTGTPAIAYAYQWWRCDGTGGACTPVAGATAPTFALSPDDVGGRMRVVVTATNAAPSGGVAAWSATSDVVGAAPPVNTATPAISGTERDGETLSASTGTWTGTAPVSFAHQWRRCDAAGGACADIAGATSSAYTAVSADVGGTLRVVVTATNAGGSADATSASSAVVAPAPPVNTAPPSTSGLAMDGQTLAADDGSWSGTPVITFTHQWQRCDASGFPCADIPGATAATYTAGPADVGGTLRVVVTADNAAPGSVSGASAPSAVVAPAPPVNLTAPSVSGSATDGETLSADDGTWGGTPPVTTTRRWQRCDALGGACTDIPGETAGTYVLVADDVGGTVRVVVTADNAAPGTVSAASAPSAVVLATPPVNTALPDIAGITQDGATLSAGPGTWTGTPTISFTYQWQRCDALGAGCTDVPGATGTTFGLTPADVGGTLRVRVSAANGAPGTAAATSAASAVIAPAGPANLTAPVVSGLAQEGETLTTTDGTWSGTPVISFTYQWRRCDASGSTCASVPGATSASYTLTAADLGFTLRAVVTASNAAPAPASAVSAATAVVAAAPPVNTDAPVVSGTARDGSTLSATDGTWTGTAPITLTRRWQRCDALGGGCLDLPGATGTTYDLTPADVGATVRVVVTADNPAPGVVVAASAPTAVVLALAPANTLVPQVSGSPLEGGVLSATPGTWTGTPAIAYAHQWQACDAGGAACADVPGATASTYTVGASDVGGTLRVVVTASNAGGSAVAVSAPVSALPAPPVNTGAPSVSGIERDGESLSADDGVWGGTARRSR
ncbi:MAG: hypothetical protein MUC84_02275 [Solirubrobacteraceae bacterium]|nr:hypothetical protein [Solirubrobacteraceae bacterium]